MEEIIEEEKKPDRRIYPDEVVRNGGMTYIPNMLLRSEMGIKPTDTKYIIYLLSKPTDWIYYHELMVDETGLSLSTIYEMNKRLDHLMTFIPSGKGDYGTGFCINFSKLYARCVEIGVKEKIQKQEKEKSVQKKRESVQNLEIDLQNLEQTLWETTTTNTDTTNTEFTNTNLSMESDDRQSFYDKSGEEGSPPCGGCPNQQSDALDELDYQKTDSKETLASYIVDIQFQNIHYTGVKKLEMKKSLLMLPLSDLKLLIKYADTWHLWCEEVSTSHGLISVKGSDHGLPLMLNKSIYAKYIKYIKEIEHKEHAEKEKGRIELEVQAQRERHDAINAIKMEEIKNLGWEKRYKLLKEFRFDLSKFDFKPPEESLELVAKDDDNPLNDVERYHKLLFRKYPPEMYNMEEMRKMKKKISEYSESDIVKRLKNFRFDMLDKPVNVAPLYFDSYAKKKSINGDVKLLYEIVVNSFPSSYYNEDIIDPDFEAKLMASLEEDE